MRPWEIKDKGGLQRYTGMTVATKTKKNQKLAMKFEGKRQLLEEQKSNLSMDSTDGGNYSKSECVS